MILNLLRVRVQMYLNNYNKNGKQFLNSRVDTENC